MVGFVGGLLAGDAGSGDLGGSFSPEVGHQYGAAVVTGALTIAAAVIVGLKLQSREDELARERELLQHRRDQSVIATETLDPTLKKEVRNFELEELARVGDPFSDARKHYFRWKFLPDEVYECLSHAQREYRGFVQSRDSLIDLMSPALVSGGRMAWPDAQRICVASLGSAKHFEERVSASYSQGRAQGLLPQQTAIAKAWGVMQQAHRGYNEAANNLQNVLRAEPARYGN